MLIGLTGGIGSGKSTIARELTQRGYRVYDTDREAKRLIVEDITLREQMIQLFGEDIYENNQYHTDLVAARVFRQPELLQQLNALVHPVVFHDLLHWQGDLVESAILYESGLNTLCSHVIAVIASEDIRLERAITRDHANEDKVRARMRAQMSDTELCAKADLVLVNDGTQTIHELANQAETFIKNL